MIRKLSNTLKNPRVQQLVMWLLPLALSWLFERFGKQGTTPPKKTKR